MCSSRSRLLRVINRYVGNLPPMPGVFPDCPAAVINDAGRGASLEAFTATRCGYSMGICLRADALSAGAAAGDPSIR